MIAGRQTYDYLICVATGKVIEFDSEKLHKLRDEICREHGFSPLSHQFHIFGLSPEAQRDADLAHGQKSEKREDGDPNLFVPEVSAGE